MDKESIILSECNNDGSFIYLYYTEEMNVWNAYGSSAYNLRLFCKSHGENSIRSFSSDMQMPCTVVEASCLDALERNAERTVDKNPSYLAVKMPESIDPDAYARWIKKLKGTNTSDDDIIVTTPVSKDVPRDKYIHDGMSDFERIVKRAGDCFLSTCGLVIFSPLFLFCYIAIKKEDGGPAIYAQERIGRFGRPFKIYKFRSMRIDAEKMGPQLSHSGGDNDPRLTKIGRFIRAHHLDELPQLYNVMRGDMAFIGYRPERKFYIDQIVEHDVRYTYLYQIRPGVTSYATLYNGYTDTMEKMLRRLEYDLYYLGHRSWWFDFKVLANTFLSIVFGKKF
ncbi:MAG: sugar transferase [Muribaculaceae bacterium]|nr:sugar transferase [Muribaculaceae bacterium]